jgi:DNA polymerase-3 subunit epsilon
MSGSQSAGFAVVDTETTGFGLTDRVIEIGVVLLDDELGPEGEWDTLINPHRSLGPTSVHHIRPTDVAGAPQFSAIAGEFIEQVRGRVVVGHNVEFDARMLNQEFTRLGVGCPVRSEFSLDTLDLTRAEHLSPTGCYTLDCLCATLDIERTIAHAALADAQATAQLLVLATTAWLTRLDQIDGPTVLWPRQHQAARTADWPTLPRTGAARCSRSRRNPEP